MKKAVFLVVLSLIARSGLALPITFGSDSTVTRVLDSDASSATQQDTFSGTAVPSSDSLSASSGTSSSSANVSLSGSAAAFSYDLSMQHSIDNSNGQLKPDYAETVVSVLNFFALENATYAMSGLYDVTAANSLEASVEAYLYDITGSAYLFLDSTKSRNVSAPLSFMLGDLGDGNYQNSTLGSLTGNLVAGHQYYFSVNARITNKALGTGYTLASGAASGLFSLDIESLPPEPTVPVSEPGAFTLLSMGLLLIGVGRRRRLSDPEPMLPDHVGVSLRAEL